jgi:chemotaxis family two-component system response regulator Rcp1
MDVQRLQVLLVSTVEQDLDDLRRLLAETGAGADVHVCPDAGDALALVRGEGAYDGAARPDVILLDLDVEGSEPFELLEALRSDRELERLPVVAIVAGETGPQVDALAEHRIHDIATRPLDGDIVRRVISFFNEV